MEVIEGVWLEDYFSDDDPTQSPMSILVDYMENNKVTKGEALVKINQLNLTPDQKRTALDLADEIYNEEVFSDEELRKRVLENLPTLRN
jgi:hypothetical protein